MFSLSDAFSAFQPEAPNVPDGSGIADALARNAQLGQIRSVIGEAMQHAAPVQIAQQQSPQRRGGLGNILGRIGDALLVANGGEPAYANKLRAREMGGAVANYLGNTDAILASIFQQDPQAGLALYKMKHPEAAQAPDIIREMTAAGIDPASDEGKAIIRGHLTKDGAAEPNFVRELQALGIDPHSPQALELYYGRNSPAGYLLKPPSVGATPAQSVPVVNTEEEYNALPAGTRYRDSQGNIGIKGGATASTPSHGF
jgi:hypothetical protein